MKKVDVERIREEISKTSEETSIYLGCDSRRYWSSKEKSMMISFTRVVVIHKDSCAGCELFGDNVVEKDFTNSVRYRMMQEVYKIVELALQLEDVIGERELQIHLDINSNPEHKSHNAMKEAMGYVKGVLGVTPKVKPEAIAASTAADRFT